MSESRIFGSICWVEIPVVSLESAKAFYKEIFGWSFVPAGNGYLYIEVGGKYIGGFRQIEKSKPKSDSPIIYFTVENIDTTIEKVKLLGATVEGKKTMVDDGAGVYQWIIDRDNNLISLFRTEP